MPNRLVAFSCFISLGCGFACFGRAELVTVPTSFHEIVDGHTGKLRLVVQVSEFQISRTQVTQDEYEEEMGENPSRYRGGRRPVENVSWWDAIRYCNLRSEREGLQPCYDLETGHCDFARDGYRLPTEWEWNVASAGADARLDPQSANIGTATTRSAAELMKLVHEKGTKEVGSYPPNKFGLYDMAGNVWEWCYDYYNEVKDTPEPSVTDPTGPAWGLARVVRGGSFLSAPYIYHLRGRQGPRYLRPDRKSPFTGFRVCRSTEKWGQRVTKQYDEDWFEPYTRVPPGFEGRGGLPSLLLDAEGQPLTSIEEWEVRRAELRAKWLQRLGVPPKPDAPPQEIVADTFDGGSYTGKIMYLQWEPDLFVKLVLMMPKRPVREPTPAVIVHWYDVDAAVGRNLGGYLQQDLKELKAYGKMMTQQGYIAVALAWWDLVDESYEESMAKLKLRFPDCTGLGKTVWDTARVVDYLYTLPEVDRNRIGCTGHCMAGITTIYSAAFEDRITTAVALGSNCSVSEGDTNYYDYWYLGEELVATIDRAGDQQELLALIAPRPFLISLGRGNTMERCYPFINTAREVYALFGKPEYLGYFCDTQERPPSASMVEGMRDWLIRFLE